MTREEALNKIGELVVYARTQNWDDEFAEAFETLSAEPCEDCISRQEVLDGIEELKKSPWATDKRGNGFEYLIKEALEVVADLCVKQLPSVTPKQKMGHWIMPVQDDGMSDPIYYQVRCSECGFDLDPQTWHMELHQYGADKYCPNCGANMREVDE